jgi:quinol monooxygenase YgiN
MSKTVVLAKVTAREGKRADVVAVLSEMVEHVNTESATEVYAMHTAVDDDVTVWFYERYSDEAGLTSHSTSETMKAVGTKLAGLLAGRPELIRLNDVAAKGLS